MESLTSLGVLLFSLYLSPASSLCTVFDPISSKMEEILSICLLMYLSLEILTRGTDRFCELCYNFCIYDDFTQMVHQPTWIPNCEYYSPAAFDFFPLTLTLFYSVFSSFGKFWSCCCLSFQWLFFKLKEGCSFSLEYFYYFCDDWDGTLNYLRTALWEHIFNFTASAATKFYKWDQV